MPRQATADRSHPRPAGALRSGSRGGFTLAELLVVIGIIVLLISILIPVVGRVRVAGQSADTSSLIRAIDAACQTYYQDHQAWPGPLAGDQLGIDAANKTAGIVIPGVKSGSDGFYRGPLLDDPTTQGVTGAENLVLGLLGGLVPVDDDSNPNTPPVIQYDPAAVGRGAVKLGGRSPGGYTPYLDLGSRDISTHEIGSNDAGHTASGSGSEGLQWGRFVDEAAAAQDSIIPEFQDRFSAPLPILYMRARPSGRITEANVATAIVGDDPAEGPVFLHTEIDSYIVPNANGASIGAHKSPKDEYFVAGSQVATAQYFHGLQLDGYPNPPVSTPPNPSNTQDLRDMMNKGSALYTYPYDARAYLLSPDSVNARQADRYVLISAGADRIYGTEDDITSFGSVR